jgi:hypothetical protein
MEHKQRHRRLRLLIKKVNKERKKQAKKIDILCTDLIAAHRKFIKRLNVINFTANFYEAIVGATDLNNLLHTACKFIKEQIPDANVAFFLRQQKNFELHMFESDKPIALEEHHLENCFTADIVDNICKSNKLCSLDDMFAMGLQGNLIKLNKISAVTIPLGQPGLSLGFILIYRSSENKLTGAEISKICAVTLGLSRAIQSCRILSHSVD